MTPRVDSIAPVMSKRPLALSDSRMWTAASAATNTPIGTLTNMVQRQEAHSVSTPPMIIPTTPPAPDTAP